MCNYRYIYYSRCRHGDFTLVDYCDKAYERAGLTPPRLRDAPEGERSTKSTPSRDSPLGAPGQSARHLKHDANTNAVEHIAEEQKVPMQQPAQQAAAPQQQTPPPTWASVVRTAIDSNSGSVAQAASPREKHCVTPAATFLSPAQRLAARLDAAKADDDSNVFGTQTVDPFGPAPGGWSPEDANRSMWIGRGRGKCGDRGRGRRESMLNIIKHGRSDSDQTVRAASSTRDRPGSESADLDLRSPADFPLLSPDSAPQPSSIANKPRSSSTSSWAHVAGLISADWPDSSSTSDPTAVSDAGTVSTSPSSFESELLDPISLAIPAIPSMAPLRASGATLGLRRHPPDSPRKPLPTEWTGGKLPVSEKPTPVVTRRKSLGNLGKASKSPTKVVPFQLATARRAAERKQKEKDNAPSKAPLKSPFSDTTPTFAIAHEEPHRRLQSPGSPSQIPRLAAPSSVRPKDIQRPPSPAAPHIQTISVLSSHVHFVEAPEVMNTPMGTTDSPEGSPTQVIEHPTGLAREESRISSELQPLPIVTDTGTDTTKEQFMGTSNVADPKRKDACSPEAVNTWAVTSSISTSLHAHASGTDSSSKPEVAISESSLTEGESSSSKPDESSEWSLHSLESATGSEASTIKGSSTRTSIPPHRRPKKAHQSPGNATAPSRLNANAQEFVPGINKFNMAFTVAAAQEFRARPQVPQEWMVTQPKNYPRGEEGPVNPYSASGKKKNKKWRTGTMVGQYGSVVGPSSGKWGISNTIRESGPGGALRAITNAPYGHRPITPIQQPLKGMYTGRGGRGLPTGAIPKGNAPIEKWWHGGGWTSTDGGPLTHAAVYDHLRSTEKAHELFPSIFRPLVGDKAKGHLGYGVLRSCGNINMVGAFEALPHYPLLCPTCQPDSHEGM